MTIDLIGIDSGPIFLIVASLFGILYIDYTLKKLQAHAAWRSSGEFYCLVVQAKYLALQVNYLLAQVIEDGVIGVDSAC